MTRVAYTRPYWKPPSSQRNKLEKINFWKQPSNFENHRNLMGYSRMVVRENYRNSFPPLTKIIQLKVLCTNIQPFFCFTQSLARYFVSVFVLFFHFIWVHLTTIKTTIVMQKDDQLTKITTILPLPLSP